MNESWGRMSSNAIQRLLITGLLGSARKEIVAFLNGLNVAAASDASAVAVAVSADDCDSAASCCVRMR